MCQEDKVQPDQQNYDQLICVKFQFLFLMAVTCSVKDNFVSNTTQKVLEWIDLFYRFTTDDNGTHDSSIMYNGKWKH